MSNTLDPTAGDDTRDAVNSARWNLSRDLKDLTDQEAGTVLPDRF